MKRLIPMTLLATIAFCAPAAASPHNCGRITAPDGDPQIYQVRVEHIACPRDISGDPVNPSAELAVELDEVEVEAYPKHSFHFPFHGQHWLCIWKHVFVHGEVGVRIECGKTPNIYDFLEEIDG